MLHPPPSSDTAFNQHFFCALISLPKCRHYASPVDIVFSPGIALARGIPNFPAIPRSTGLASLETVLTSLVTLLIDWIGACASRAIPFHAHLLIEYIYVREVVTHHI